MSRLTTCFCASLLGVAVVCTGLCVADPVASGPRPAAEAPRAFGLPPGFQATLFAGEPDLVQPIAFTFDDRGRLWAIENHSYPGWKGESRDRVVILSDHDGDGTLDERKVFLENGSNLSGIEWGFGGIWLCSTPYLTFVPDHDRDDQPDGPPVVKLDGWDLKAMHNVTNSLTWGPDGWLYGCNGILSNSRVGRPGTPDNQRIAINCGVWRFHPVRETWEVFAHGTTNPWGLDFDENGQMFITNCVIQHLWHVVPGARFQRMFGEDFNPHTYELMGSCSDHLHWAGTSWRDARGGPVHHAHGGGHAHVGAMIYLGDNWPESYRQSLFTCNIHGNRVNQDRLERHGSGYVGRHADELLMANDSWFRGMTIKMGPDGGVYVSDWCDTGECHNYEVVDRSNGRIFKITYGAIRHATPRDIKLHDMTNEQLVELLSHRNDWWARQARRILQERHASQGATPALLSQLVAQVRSNTSIAHRLRALWALHAVGGVTESLLEELLQSPEEVIRGWSVRLGVELYGTSSRLHGMLQDLASRDQSAWVQLALASAAPSLPRAASWPLVLALSQSPIDPHDQNLILMVWYAWEPHVTTDVRRTAEALPQVKIAKLREFIARRMAASHEESALTALVHLLQRSEDQTFRSDLLRGLHTALQGQRKVPMPAGWSAVYPQLVRSDHAEVQELGLLISILFGDPQAIADAQQLAEDRQVAGARRQRAIEALVVGRVEHLAPLLQRCLPDQAVQIAALRGLGAVFHEQTARSILQEYARMGRAERTEAINTLASRIPFAQELVAAVDDGQVPRTDITPSHLQQLQALPSPDVQAWISRHYGTVRPTSIERAALIEQHKQRLAAGGVEQADLKQGRRLFDKRCATCHRLFDAGGQIGPDLTGGQRHNIDYLLTNILDPSAVVAGEYALHAVQTTDGRTLTGRITREDSLSLTLQTTTETIVVPLSEVETRTRLEQSMMPEGLLLGLNDQEIRDLVAYLAATAQVP